MTDVATGVGWTALRPERLRLRAWAPANINYATGQPEGEASETVTSTLTKAEVQYGGLGTCQGASVTVVNPPAGWLSGLYTRYVLLDLYSEHGWQTVWRGVLRSVTVRGIEGTCELVGLHSLFADALGDEQEPGSNYATPLLYWPLVQQYVQYGVDTRRLVTVINNKLETRGSRLNAVLEAYPQADWGITPTGVAVAGLPQYAQRASIGRGSMPAQYTGDLANLGYTEPPYLTDAVVPWPEGFEATGTYKDRNSVPLLTPRRSGQASVDPSTLITVEPQVIGGGTPGAALPADGSEVIFVQGGALEQRSIGLPTRTGERRPKTLRVSVPIQLTAISGTDSVTIAVGFSPLPDSLKAGTLSTLTLTAAQLGLVQVIPYTVDRDLLERMTGLVMTFAAQGRTGTDEARIRLGPIRASADIEVKNTGGVTPPDGWNMPYQTGPTYERTLNRVWHIPPGVDGEVGRNVAGAVVTWERTTATTVCQLGALPYPGQRRTG